MANKEKAEIKITDRRLFNEEGELRPDIAEEEAAPVAAPTPQPPPAAPEAAKIVSPSSAHVETPTSAPPPPVSHEVPDAPTAAEEQASRDAFHDAGAQLDDALHTALGDKHRPEALEATFESFIASLYMSAMFQLGLLREKDEQQPPQVDLVGARHTIDTLSMLEEKTRGNLTDAEKSILQDCLFRLRMAFVEITNLLTRPPAPGTVPPGVMNNPGKK